MQDVLTRFRDALADEKDSRARLKCLIGMHLNEFQSYPELAAVFQVELRQSSRFVREYENNALRRYLDLIGEIVTDGQKEGVFRTDIPLGLIKRFIFGTLDETVSTWVLAGRDYDLISLADPIRQLFLQGIHQTSEQGKTPNEGGKDYETTR
jgi:TetR/AcrR family fatty acid metabolism transcriptional regulator